MKKMKYDKTNPYYKVTYGKPNCTMHASQCVKNASGKFPAWNGNPYVKGKNTTIWEYKDGYSRHEYRSKALKGQVAIFNSPGSKSGHVAYITKVDDNYIYLSEQDYYQKESGYYETKLSKKRGTNHPRWENMKLIGFRGTHASLHYANGGK